ncbi:phage terminase, small subunit [Sulfuriferula multivorans]|uniref:Phage terminase, small subunit n=1 Tax=Sulfuriferula multivorans TaxID=1559896 RepID=A0A401JF65_9PROT|nr:phage protein Gp27 family protein [Sulfuriferula multivorans]GBL46265.1 phage terminase, small subunit [Sulfuriferula multivorans]
MARPSSVKRLDPSVRAAVDDAIREGRATIEDIVALLRNLGADISRSAVGRYKQQAESQMARYREAQEVAKVWIGRLESDPEGDVGRLLPEMLRAVAFQQLAGLEDGQVDSKEIALLARAIKDAAGATKTSVEAERLRREMRDALRKVETAAETVSRDPAALKRAIAAAYGLL